MSVDYYITDKTGVEIPLLQQACFAALGAATYYCPHTHQYVKGLNDYLGVRYVARVNNLTLGQVKTWDQFLHDMFDTQATGAFTSEITEAGGVITITYRLKTVGMPRARQLTYLTAMRYVDEFSSRVKTVVKKTGVEAQFAELRVAHGGSCGSGHELMAPGYEAPALKKADLAIFHRNLKANVNSVYNHFVEAAIPWPVSS